MLVSRKRIKLVFVTVGLEWSFRSIVHQGHVSNLKLNSNCKNVVSENSYINLFAGVLVQAYTNVKSY
jgi:hypothetical protein